MVCTELYRAVQFTSATAWSPLYSSVQNRPISVQLSYARSTTNHLQHLITFAATLPSSPPSSALITILPFMSPPLRPLCIHSAFINTIIHLRPFFDRLPIIYVVSSFRA